MSGRLVELIQNSPWAILLERLDAIHEVLCNHTNGVKFSLSDLEATLGYKLENTYNVNVIDGVAVIPVYGVLAKRMNMFAAISGGTSYELVGRDFEAAIESDDINGIVLDTDSPGGVVDGVELLAKQIVQARGKKPIIAYANGLMASAAYWIGSAADKIVTPATATIGSIGVMQVHYDYSKRDEMEGVKRTALYAGKYKVVGNDTAPLSAEDKAVLQDHLDYLYSIFVDGVAANRGVDSKTVLENMADGKLFIGQRAIEAGLADELGDFKRALELAADGAGIAGTNGQLSSIVSGKAIGQQNVNVSIEGGVEGMDLQELKDKHPDAFAGLMSEAKAHLQESFEAEKASLVKDYDQRLEGMKSENKELHTRVLALEKRDAIREEKERADIADRIWERSLATSELPDYLHTKVKAFVRYQDHVVDSKLDQAGFQTAVDAEIKDWESHGLKRSAVQGGGVTRRDVSGVHVDPDVLTDEDENDINEMLRLAGDNAALAK